MTLLDPIKGKQPLRTLGEFRQFTKDLPDDVLLESFPQYGDEETTPIVASVEEPEDPVGEPGHFYGRRRLCLHGYEQYKDDPDLSQSWAEVVE